LERIHFEEELEKFEGSFEQDDLLDILNVCRIYFILFFIFNNFKFLNEKIKFPNNRTFDTRCLKNAF
jgi:hypothetical protein